MIYFTSDLHLGHQKVIPKRHRPYETADEMTRDIADKYNSVVGENDTVYILGDLCGDLSPQQANELIASLHGRKHLLIGNHDPAYDPSLFEEMRDFLLTEINGRYFAMMHYPLLAWPKIKKGCIQVHGHLHSSMDYNLKNREDGILRYDVGVEANGFVPVSIDRIIDFFS